MIKNPESIISRLIRILEEIRSLEVVNPIKIESWLSQVGTIRSMAEENILRVAVTGTVKSGKSTLINSLFGDDLLKRGTGITTSFVTRIKTTTDSVGGWVELKSLEEVNQEIRAILSNVFLEENFKLPGENFDISKDSSREIIRSIVESFSRSASLDFNPYVLTLNSYLLGFEELKDHLQEREAVKQLFGQTNILDHRKFVSNDAISLYVKNVELLLSAPWLGVNIEIGDCQGADSPNPIHLALLQDYLLRANFVIYVINSKIGLRDADFRLLEFIRNLGLIPNTFFVLNLDIDAHSSLEDVMFVKNRVLKDLQWFGKKDNIFVFSALLELLKALPFDDSNIEVKKIIFWEKLYPKLFSLSGEHFEAFKKTLISMVEGVRVSSVFNHIMPRLKVVTFQILESVLSHGNMLRVDLEELEAILKDLENCKILFENALNIVENTVSDYRKHLIRDFLVKVDEFFDVFKNPVLLGVVNMVDCCYPPFKGDSIPLKEVYRFYIESRQAVARAVVDKVNIEIADFCRELEELLAEKLKEYFNSLTLIFQTAIKTYRDVLSRRLGIKVENSFNIKFVWEAPSNIQPPSFYVLAKEQALGKGVLFLKFGLEKIIKVLSNFKDALGRRSKSYKKASVNEFSDIVGLIREEIRAELIETVERYKEKFEEYVVALIDKGTNVLIKEFFMTYRSYLSNFDHLLELSKLRESEKEKIVANIARLASELESLSVEIG